ncbi:hypothetical protein ACUHGC_01910 [Testudinibacter sp. P27/CKL/0425]
MAVKLTSAGNPINVEQTGGSISAIGDNAAAMELTSTADGAISANVINLSAHKGIALDASNESGNSALTLLLITQLYTVKPVFD